MLCEKKVFAKARHSPGYDDLWQADIVKMRPYSGFNRGHYYILTVIDVLSKYT